MHYNYREQKIHLLELFKTVFIFLFISSGSFSSSSSSSSVYCCFSGHYKALGRVISAQYLKESLTFKDPNFNAATRNTMELVEQLTILADIFYIEVNRLKKHYSNVIVVWLFYFIR